MSARDESTAEKLLEALDPDQRAVAQYAAGPMAVLAGAGTGKTRAITYRIAYGVARGIYDPANVLAVTFTKRAAVEMRERLAALGVPGVQARTFHSAALRQLQFFWPSAIGGSMPPLIEHKASLISSAAARLGIRADKALVRDLAAEVEWAKVSMLDADAYADAVRTNTRTTPGDLSVDDVLSVMDAYQIAKEDRGVLDFEDVLVLTAGIMQDYPAIAKRIRDQYRYFVVDEYQDVSALQQHLLNLWLGGRHDICVVGDVAQTIYSFAGASPRYLQDFADAHKGARVVELVRDYRSTPQIVCAANALMKGEHSSVLKGAVKLVSQREDGVPVSYRSFDDDAEEARGIAEDIRSLHEAGAAYSSIAILYRTNGQSESFEAQLAEAGIPFIVHSGMRFFEREEVRRAMYLLKKQATMLRNEGKDESDLVQLVEDLVGIAGWSAKAPSGQGALRERWDNLNGWTFHNHNYVGAKMVPAIFRRMKLPMDNKMRFVQKMVDLHMRPIAIADEEVTDSAVRRLMNDAGDDIDALMMLCEADITSKNQVRKQRFLDNFRIVREKIADLKVRDYKRLLQPCIDGNEIMEMFHLGPCREVGQLKQTLKDAVLDNKVENEREPLMKLLMDKAKSMGLVE